MVIVEIGIVIVGSIWLSIKKVKEWDKDDDTKTT